MPSDHSIAVCPGSYDPVTCGHLDVIARAAGIFDHVIVAVVNASVRKSRALFSAEERVGFIAESTTHLANVEVQTFDVLIVDFARRVGATSIVKGLRAISDFEYEFEMNQLNRKLAPDIDTVYLMASPQYSFLSSSGVKEMAQFGGDVSGLVPDVVIDRLSDALDRRKQSE
jgi:pantetheine-phosphate adenylyltransferase